MGLPLREALLERNPRRLIRTRRSAPRRACPAYCLLSCSNLRWAARNYAWACSWLKDIIVIPPLFCWPHFVGGAHSFSTLF